MKISPIASGATPTINPNEGVTASPDKLERAKAIAAGEDPSKVTNIDKQADRAMNSIKKIKMRTQQSTNRHETPVEAPAEPVETQETAPVGDKTDTTEQTPVASEATKPLSPRFAALAKQKREIQLERQKLDADKAALATQSGNTKSLEEYRAKLKANALSVLLEEGVTYDQLTEQILAQNQNGTDLSALRAELKAEIKSELEAQNKLLADRDVASENQVRAQIKRNVDQLVAQGDDFEMIREAGYSHKVVELIDNIWKKEGLLLDESEAATIIENELLEDSLKWAKIKKVQSRLAPPQTEKPQPVSQDRPGTKIMRTLTNRDGASSVSMSKRERAIAAMEGRLK